VIFQLIMLNI